MVLTSPDNKEKTDFLGFENIILRVRALLKSNRMPPVVLFHGRPGIGKRFLLKALAQEILCANQTSCGDCADCKRVALSNHPKMLMLDDSIKVLKIEHAREIQEHLNLASGLHNYRVVVISDVERMNHQAVNRLLKTLEEPPDRTIVLMSSSAIRSILDTLRSRAVKWIVRPPNIENFKAIIMAKSMSNGWNSITQKKLEALARRAGFSPGLALKILGAEQNIEKEDLGDIIFGSKSYAKSLDGVASYLGNIKQTPKEAIVNIEQALNNFYRSRLQSIESNHVSLSEIRKRRHILSEMRRATMSNETVYNVSMIMESVASC